LQITGPLQFRRDPLQLFSKLAGKAGIERHWRLPAPQIEYLSQTIRRMLREHRVGSVREPPLQPPRTAQPTRLHAMPCLVTPFFCDNGPELFNKRNNSIEAPSPPVIGYYCFASALLQHWHPYREKYRYGENLLHIAKQ
jgi:hypothetical protein